MTNFAEVWRSFTHEEKHNIGWYILGIMMYKLGLEFFNGSITTLATDRFRAANTFTKLGAAQGLNQAMQCVGAILIAPLVKALPTRTVLAAAVTFFALMTTLLLIIDAATGGSIKRAGATRADYGSWNPNLIFVIWSLSGIAYGMVELIRRVIPADVVGGNVSKLRRMDATVHVLYEVAGTSGAFASSAAITRLGNNYSFLVTPIFFVLAAVAWSFVGALRTTHNQADGDEPALAAVDKDGKKKNYFAAVANGGYLFCKSVGLGAWIVMSHRRFVWLFPGYAVALYLHRFLESSLAPAFARRVLNVSAYSQIIVGGSNFGELLGAATVFLLSDYVPTPLPWLRLDALALNIVWILPRFSQIAQPRQVRWAWYIAGCFIPISFGWAAGDVSLAAYIQSSLTTMDFAAAKDVSALGAVMAFLYSTYIVFNAVLSSVLGRVIDQDFTRTGTIYTALQQVGGIQFSVASALILLATLIPIGAFAINPEMLNSMPLQGDVAHEEASDADYVAKGVDGTYGSDSDSVERELKKLAAVSA